jgi:hypothetical protein
MSGYGPNPTDGGTPQAAPGWYPDPAGSPVQRWWDGTAWSPATQEYAPSYVPAVPAIRNTRATAGLVLGIVAMVVDPLGVPAILGIIFSGLGLSRAGELQRVGYGPVGRTRAVWGLVLSILGLLGTATVKLWLF